MSDPEEEEIYLYKKRSYDKGIALIHEEGIDAESSYSIVYLTSVFHDNVQELKNCLKKQYLYINGKIIDDAKELDEYEDPKFEEEWKDLDITQCEDEEVVKNVDKYSKRKKRKLNLFLSSFAVAMLAAVIQLGFVLTIIKEYYYEEIFIASDPELITIRICTFISLVLFLYTEFTNGKKIFRHAIYHGYLYRSFSKRVIVGIAGFIQCLTSIFCMYASEQLILHVQVPLKVVKCFADLFIITEIDNYLGSYFIGTSRPFQVYTNNRVVQLMVVRKNFYTTYHTWDLIVDLPAIMVVIFSAFPIYLSFK